MEHRQVKHGVVKGVRESWDDPTMAEVEMDEPPTAKQMAEHRARQKAAKKGKGQAGAVPVGEGPGKPHGRSHHITMPKHVASHFGIGHPVELEQTLRHFGHHSAAEKDSPQAKGGED